MTLAEQWEGFLDASVPVEMRLGRASEIEFLKSAFYCGALALAETIASKAAATAAQYGVPPITLRGLNSEACNELADFANRLRKLSGRC